MKKRIVIAMTMAALAIGAAGCGQSDNQMAGIPINQQTAQTGGQGAAGQDASGAGSQTAQSSGSNAQPSEVQNGNTAGNAGGQSETGAQEPNAASGQTQEGAQEPNTASGQNQGGTQSQTGAQTQQQNAGTITEEQAKAAALAHAGLTEQETAGIRVKQDREDGRLVFDVEFYAGASEYDYEIAADTGEILKSDFNIEEDFMEPGQGGGWSQNQTIISADDAKKLIVEKVPGLDSANIRIKLDMDDGRQIYEGEFFFNNKEYEFEMDAVSGTFLEWNEENF